MLAEKACLASCSFPICNSVSGGLSGLEKASDFSLPGMMRSTNREWGKLREQRVEDAIEGRRDEYDPEFNNAIQAYTKGLGRHPK